MNRSKVPMVVLLAWLVAPGTSPADSPTSGFASKAWAITDLVLARHVDPPARQAMLLGGLKAAARGKAPKVDRLALRASNLARPEDLAAILDELWNSPKSASQAEREREFLDGLLGAIPGDAELFSAKERKVAESMEANLYVGIQVALGLGEKADQPSFLQIFEGGPADLAGIKPGDVIEAINGEASKGMPLAQVVDRLRGEEGTSVEVRCRRPATGEVFTRSLARVRLPHPTIEGLEPLADHRWRVRLDDASPIGYLRIKEIGGSTPREIQTFADQLESEGAKALILDLRGASASGFHATVLLADALLDGGVIGQVASTEGEKTIRAEPDALFRGWPMVALVDDVTPAAAAAWLAWALEDNHRATVLGANFVSHDPVVSEMIPLPGGDWSVRFPTGRLQRGDGQALLRKDPATMNAENARDKLPRERVPSRARVLLETALKAAKKP